MPTFADIPQCTSIGRYEVTVLWEDLEYTLQRFERNFSVNLNPDFQRKHVWSKLQQRQYVEFVLQGGQSGKIILFNHPNWMKSFEGHMVLVDGKQRLHAVQQFLHNDLEAFGYTYKEYTDRLQMTQHYFLFNINNLQYRTEVLQYYIDFNTGGTTHTHDEIAKVHHLLQMETTKISHLLQVRRGIL
jgi:uncharacterized protein with ParB-like and HNH nuclease domain